MTMAEADRHLRETLQDKTVQDMVDMLFSAGETAATDPFALVFGTPGAMVGYKACFVQEIEKRINKAREAGVMSVVKHL